MGGRFKLMEIPALLAVMKWDEICLFVTSSQELDCRQIDDAVEVQQLLHLQCFKCLQEEPATSVSSFQSQGLIVASFQLNHLYF